jgi:hypothetical protein
MMGQNQLNDDQRGERKGTRDEHQALERIDRGGERVQSRLQDDPSLGVDPFIRKREFYTCVAAPRRQLKIWWIHDEV